MVGAITPTSPTGPARQVRSPQGGAAHPPASRSAARTDWVDIANLGVAGFDQSPGAQAALIQLAVGDCALGEVAGLLGDVKKLLGQRGQDYSSDDAATRQVKIDALLASVDRLAGTARFGGSPLLNGGTVTTGGQQIVLPAIGTQSLGAVAAGGWKYTLSDLRSGGALASISGDAAGASRVINAAIAQVAGTRGEMAAFAIRARGDSAGDSTSPSMESLKSIREMMLAGGAAAFGEGNRSGIFQMLK